MQPRLRKIYKKAWCTCKVVVCQSKPTAFMPFSLTTPSSLLKLPINVTQLSWRWTGIRVWPQVWPEKTAEISRRHYWFPRQMTSEKRVQIFHSDILLMRMSTTEIWVATRHQYGISASDVISPWNLWWHLEMLAVFSGFIRFKFTFDTSSSLTLCWSKSLTSVEVRNVGPLCLCFGSWLYVFPVAALIKFYEIK